MTKLPTDTPPKSLPEAISRAEQMLDDLSPSDAKTLRTLIAVMKTRPPQPATH